MVVQVVSSLNQLCFAIHFGWMPSAIFIVMIQKVQRNFIHFRRTSQFPLQKLHTCNPESLIQWGMYGDNVIESRKVNVVVKSF